MNVRENISPDGVLRQTRDRRMKRDLFYLKNRREEIIQIKCIRQEIGTSRGTVLLPTDDQKMRWRILIERR
jgi:hypothetical protein